MSTAPALTYGGEVPIIQTSSKSELEKQLYPTFLLFPDTRKDMPPAPW